MIELVVPFNGVLHLVVAAVLAIAAVGWFVWSEARDTEKPDMVFLVGTSLGLGAMAYMWPVMLIIGVVALVLSFLLSPVIALAWALGRRSR